MKKYYLIHPAVFKLDGGAMFGIIPKPLWEKQRPSDSFNRIDLSLRLMLIQTTHKNILIDTGIGEYHDEKFIQRFGVDNQQQSFRDLLKAELNLTPEDITDLVISHLHFDHVGGLMDGVDPKKSFFPNALLHLHQKHFEYSLRPTQRDAGSFQKDYFLPLINEAIKNNKINWLMQDDGTIINDKDIHLKYKTSHGHTPFLVHAYDENFIYMADLVPTLSHVPVAWVMGYDISPGVTTLDKQEFYKFISQNNLTMVFEHDCQNWGAQISFTDQPSVISTLKAEDKVQKISF